MASNITALVIQFNHTPYVGDVDVTRVSGSNRTTGIGISTIIPCPDNGGVIDGDYWATPVNDGVVNGFIYKSYNIAEAVSSKPTVDSFAVVRITDSKTSKFYYALGTSTQYLASCAVCCSDPLVPMPDATDLPFEAGCQTLCNFDADNNYFAVLGLPTLTGNARYFPFGYFNNVELPAATGTGYATTGDLLTFLNTAVTGWAAVGTWTLSGDGETVIATQTDGPGDDVLCAYITAINPSA